MVKDMEGAMDIGLELFNGLITLGAIAAAITGICALVVKACKAIKSVIIFFNDLRANVNMLIEHDKDQYLSILRLTIVNESMPVSERLLAGKIYLDRGGNGDVKELYQELEEQCEQINRSDTQ